MDGSGFLNYGPGSAKKPGSETLFVEMLVILDYFVCVGMWATSILLDLPTNRQPPGGGPSYASLFSQGDSSSLLPSLALTGIFIRKWCVGIPLSLGSKTCYLRYPVKC